MERSKKESMFADDVKQVLDWKKGRMEGKSVEA